MSFVPWRRSVCFGSIVVSYGMGQCPGMPFTHPQSVDVDICRKGDVRPASVCCVSCAVYASLSTCMCIFIMVHLVCVCVFRL